MDLIENKLHFNRHPWELSIVNALLKFIKERPSHYQYTDIGAGDQFYAEAILGYTDCPVYAVDVNYTKIGKKGKIIELKSIEDLPEDIIDCMILLDVLEYVFDDRIFLTSLLKKLKENGEVIIMVPAFQLLFSSNDIFFGITADIVVNS